MHNKDVAEPLDEWKLLCRYFPAGWRPAARSLGALRRGRQIRDPATLLRCLLVHLAEGCSLAETSVRVRQLGLANVSSVALFKRLRNAEQWLRWLAEQLWRQRRTSPAVQGRRIRAVDATIVDEPGRTGSLWRIHYTVNLADLQCDSFVLTDKFAGERFQNVPLLPGDVILGDRAYGTPPGVAYVRQHKSDVLVRINLRMLPLHTAAGRSIGILSRLRRLRVGEIRQWPAFVHHGRKTYAGRLVGVKRSRTAAEKTRRRLKRQASRRQKQVSPAVWEAAQYIFVWTSLPEDEFPAEVIMELYRLRWQIELAFKRMKSILGMGQLPKHSDESARAWLHGKLFVALLIERLIQDASDFSPWGYHLESPA